MFALKAIFKFIFYTIIICLVIYGIMWAYKKVTGKEDFSGYHHRSNLASTFWIKKPQIQHTFKDLKLQYPCHHKYFDLGCDEKEPANAEICRYHKHRFDPNQM